MSWDILGRLKRNVLFIIFLYQYIEIIQHWPFLYLGSFSRDLDWDEQQLCSLALKHNDNASCGLFIKKHNDRQCENSNSCSRGGHISGTHVCIPYHLSYGLILLWKTLLRFPWPQRNISLHTNWLLMGLYRREMTKHRAQLFGSKNNALYKTFFKPLKACLFLALSHLHSINDRVQKDKN